MFMTIHLARATVDRVSSMHAFNQIIGVMFLPVTAQDVGEAIAEGLVLPPFNGTTC